MLSTSKHYIQTDLSITKHLLLYYGGTLRSNVTLLITDMSKDSRFDGLLVSTTLIPQPRHCFKRSSWQQQQQQLWTLI